MTRTPTLLPIIFSTVITAAAFVLGCTGPQMAAPSDDPLVEGARLYHLRCGSCHDLYPPYSYPAQQWPMVMRRMQGPAQLTNEQNGIVLKWLQKEAD